MTTRRIVGKRLNEGLSIDPVDLATLCHEHDILVNALTKISEGDIGRPQRVEHCVHGSYGFQPCESCYMDYAAKVLEELK